MCAGEICRCKFHSAVLDNCIIFILTWFSVSELQQSQQAGLAIFFLHLNYDYWGECSFRIFSNRKRGILRIPRESDSLWSTSSRFKIVALFHGNFLAVRSQSSGNLLLEQEICHRGNRWTFNATFPFLILAQTKCAPLSFTSCCLISDVSSWSDKNISFTFQEKKFSLILRSSRCFDLVATKARNAHKQVMQDSNKLFALP